MTKRDPFHCSVCVSERLKTLRNFSPQDCLDALQNTPCLQESVEKAIRARLAKFDKQAANYRAKSAQIIPTNDPNMHTPWKLTPQGICGYYVLNALGGFVALCYSEQVGNLIVAAANNAEVSPVG